MLTSCTSFLINITIPEEYSNLKTCCKLKLTYSNIYSAQIEKTIWLLKEQNGELTKYKTEPAMIIGEGTNGTPEV